MHDPRPTPDQTGCAASEAPLVFRATSDLPSTFKHWPSAPTVDHLIDCCFWLYYGQMGHDFSQLAFLLFYELRSHYRSGFPSAIGQEHFYIAIMKRHCNERELLKHWTSRTSLLGKGGSQMLGAYVLHGSVLRSVSRPTRS